MQLRMTPKISPRYWVAILVASMLGTNLGDLLPDFFGLSPLTSLIVLAVGFVLIVLTDLQATDGSEASYWIALLLVRAAATIVADFSIDRAEFGYVPVILVLGALLGILVNLHRRDNPESLSVNLAPTGMFYWATMLVAGSLGTVIADGVGHAFGKVQIGVPVSAAIASAFIVVLLSLRHHLNWVTATSYWIAVVGVRWWGTNTGDIAKFTLTIWVSMAITATALAAILVLWRVRPTVRDDDPQIASGPRPMG